MTSLTRYLNLHLLCMGSEKKLQKKLYSCEHEVRILMSQGGLSHASFTVPFANRISLPCAKIHLCCRLIWGSVKQCRQGSCSTSEDMGCFNWELAPLSTSLQSQQEFVTQSRGCPCPPLPCPSALLGSSCQGPHS